MNNPKSTNLKRYEAAYLVNPGERTRATTCAIAGTQRARPWSRS